MRPSTAAALAVSCTVVLGGCFAGTSSDNGRSPGGTAEASQRIRVAMLLPPRSGLSPFSDDAFKLSRWSTAETLVTLDAEGNPRPGLATSWDRKDPRTWRLALRSGVTFHDGAALDAAAVRTALVAAHRAAKRPRILDGLEFTVTEDGADAVVVVTETPDPLLVHKLSSPQLAILAPAAYSGTAVDPVRHGTGPFVLTQVSGTTGARLDRYDGYWGQPAAAAGIDVSFVPDGTARAAALRTGTADLVEAIPVSQAALIDPARLNEVPMPRTNALYLNTKSRVFSDPAVRAAAAAAVQREPLVSTVYEKRADVGAGLLGPALPWAAPLRKPAALPAAATPAGTRIVLGTYSDRPELPEVAVALQQQLQARGFVVTLDVREYAQIESDALAGRFDAFILSRATVLDSGDPVAYLTSDFSCQGSFNLAKLCDPAIDAALLRAAALEPGQARRQAVMEVERAILSTAAVVPLLHERVLQGEAAGLSGAARDPRERLLVTVTTRRSGA